MKQLVFYTVVILLLSVVLAALIAGCEKKKDTSDERTKAAAEPESEKLPEGLTPEQAAKVVAKVGDQEITVGDVTRQINNLSPYIRRRWAAPEKRKEFLDKLIRVELLSQEAQRLGMDKDPEVEHTVKQTMIRLMVKNDLEKNLLPATIDDEELKKEYDKAHDTYHRPAQIRASHILVKTKAEADSLLADLKAHKEDGSYFRKKAREVSIDEQTKERGGDLGYFTKLEDRRETDPELPPEIASAAWSLAELGDLVDKPVKTDKGFSIVKLTNKRAKMDRSFESVKRVIESRVLRDKRKEGMDEFIEDLRKKSKIEMFPENMDKISMEPPAPPLGTMPETAAPAGPKSKKQTVKKGPHAKADVTGKDTRQ